MKESQVNQGQAFIAHDQASEVAEPGEGAFDLPTTLIAGLDLFRLLTAVFPIPSIRDQQANPSLAQLVPQLIRIIRLISNEAFGSGFRAAPAPPWHLDSLQGRFRQSYFRRRRRGNGASQRNTLAVDHHQPLRALPPLGGADAVAPFLAGAKLPSRKLSLQSNWPRASSSARNCRHTSNHTSCSSHNCKRRQQVLGRGYSGGRSRQRAPVLSTHKMPSNTRRLSAHGRPRPEEWGSNGSIFFHCSSDKNGFGIPSFSHFRCKGAREKYLHHFTI